MSKWSRGTVSVTHSKRLSGHVSVRTTSGSHARATPSSGTFEQATPPTIRSAATHDPSHRPERPAIGDCRRPCAQSASASRKIGTRSANTSEISDRHRASTGKVVIAATALASCSEPARPWPADPAQAGDAARHDDHAVAADLRRCRVELLDHFDGVARFRRSSSVRTSVAIAGTWRADRRRPASGR